MNLYQMATRGVDLGALPDEEAPRALFDFGPAASPVARGAVPAGMDDLFDAAAAEYGVDSTILKGIAYAESRFRPDIISGKVTSPAGALGLMQFMPATAKELGINPLDPAEAVFGAAAYLRQSLDKFGGDTERAIASYNWGRNRDAFARDDWYKSLPAETRNYVGTVLEFADGVAPKPAAAGKQVPLPDGVQPSQAGGGRGVVNPAAGPVLPARREVPGMSVGSVAQDVVSGALQIGPTAVKGVADLARLATGDYLGKDLSDSMEGGIKAIQGVVGSDRAAAQRENFQRDMADPNVSIGQTLANNKGALADQVLPTLGSMLLPVGAAGLAGKAATAGKAAAALDTAALASRVATAQKAAGIGATAAQNAADVFAGLVDKGVPMEDAYKAAGITVPFSVIAGKLTGGGAEVALARQAAGQAVKGGAVGVVKGAGREGLQEVGEELGQVTGEAVGTGEAPNATNAGKRLAVAGTLGAVVGGGVDVAGHIGAKAAAEPAPAPVPRVEDQSTTPQAPPRNAPAGEGEISIADAVGQARAELGGTVPAAAPAPAAPTAVSTQPAASAVDTQPESGPLSPQQKQEIARARTQALLDAEPGATPQVQSAPATTQADVQRLATEARAARDADETRQIEAMVAADEQAAQGRAAATAQASAAETQQGQADTLAVKARQRVLDDLTTSYGEANGYEAGRTLPAIEQQLQTLGEPPLTQSERERTAESLGRAQAFAAANPGSEATTVATVPDRGSDNSSLEAQIKERAEPQPAPQVEMVDLPSGQVELRGDAKAVRAHLVASGVPAAAVRGSPKGVIVSKTVAAQARQAFKLPAAPAPAPAVTAPEAANARQAPAAQTASTTDTAQAPNVARADAPVPAAVVPAAGGAAASVQADVVKGDPAGISEAAPGVRQALGDQPAAGSSEIVQQGSAADEAMAVQYSRGSSPARTDAEKARILQGAPVAELKGEDVPATGMAGIRAWAAGLFARFGGVARNPEIGAVDLGERSVRSSLSHGKFSFYKNLAFAAVKNVIEQGAVVVAADHRRDARSYYISAPVKMDGLDNIVTVLVRTDPNGQRMYLHSVSVKENLLNRRVSGTDTASGVERSGSSNSGEDSILAQTPENGKSEQEFLKAKGEEVGAELNRLLRFDVNGQMQNPPGTGSARLQLPGERRSSGDSQGENVAADEDGVKGPEAEFSKEMSPDLAAAILRATGTASVESVQAAVEQLVGANGRLPGGLGSVVVATSGQIKADWEPLIGPVAMGAEQGGRAAGFYDPLSRTVFLIADHIKAGQEVAVAAHELMHKHGQAVLGKKGWDLLHDTIGGWATAAEGSMERQVYDDAAARVASSRPAGADAGKYSTQELFPYAVQVALEMGVEPTGARPITTVQGWLARVRNSIQQVFGKLTGNPEDFKSQDLVNLAFGIAQRENPDHAGELDGAVNLDEDTEGGLQYSRAAAPPPAPSAPVAQPAAAPERTPLPAETRARAAQRVMQDKLNRFTVLGNWAKENDIELSSEADVWGYEARMHGTVATRVEDFREGTVKPVIDRIQKAGFTTEQVAEYLHAAHAEERNAQIASIDPKTLDGSGMTNAEAQAILAKAPPGLAALATEVQSITESTRQILLDAGIISQEMSDAWSEAYKNYVPLKGGDEAKQGGVGKGLSVDGRQKRALGHGARDEKVIENILRDHERAIMLAEKNKVGQAMLVLVDELNNPDIATINQPERRRVLKQGTMYEVRTPDGIVVDSFTTSNQALQFVGANPGMKLQVKPVKADPMVVSMATPMLQPNEAQVYVKGHAVRVQLNDEGLARAYKHMGVESLTTLMKVNREINAALSKAYTAYNPEFLLKNIARDFTAGLAITTAKYGAGVSARAVKNYPMAMAKLIRYGFTGKATGTVAQYRLSGGSTGAAYLGDLARIGEDVQATFDDARGAFATARGDGTVRGVRTAMRKSIKSGLKLIEILNGAGESAMRLSVFEAMQESGNDLRASASAAKELLNFNRNGEATRTVGGWYLFLNASIQGTAALADAMVHGKHREQGWAMVAGMAGLFYALAQAQFGGDDEDKKAWDRISPDVKAKNLIIRTGADSYITLPMPYGLGAFFGVGNAAHDLQQGKDVDKVALDLALLFADQFLPVKPYSEGGDTRGLVELVPGVAGGELMRAALRAGVNRSGLGGDIVPDSKFDESRPDHLRAYRNTKTSVYQTIADQLNAASGGTQTQAGLVDVSPETLKYWTRTLTGGAGVFLTDTFDAVMRRAEYQSSPDDPDREALLSEAREIPILRGFVRDEGISDDRRNYWGAAKDVRRADQDRDRAKKMGDEVGWERVEEQRGELLGLVKMMERSSKHIKEIRDEVEEIMLDEGTSMAYKRAQVKKLEAEESGIYREFIEAVAEDRAAAGK
ncbi:LPD38 domain-containing protein [Acidovorax sp. A1169]|uniref:LPD38 domain-containing protein n=1 Tax=Acidovorax sp. A1169 TaxID=3059524 RepID=UPI002737BA9C|nr:LPD38 domain-containing protein [Acidovorax sp. A1169]MDP4076243.1 LPD38 domain-containing protein [Acidovorax sp. A1169]